MDRCNECQGRKVGEIFKVDVQVRQGMMDGQKLIFNLKSKKLVSCEPNLV